MEFVHACGQCPLFVLSATEGGQAAYVRSLLLLVVILDSFKGLLPQYLSDLACSGGTVETSWHTKVEKNEPVHRKCFLVVIEKLLARESC